MSSKIFGVAAGADRDLRVLFAADDPVQSRPVSTDGFELKTVLVGEAGVNFGKLKEQKSFSTLSYGTVSCPAGSWVWLDGNGNMIRSTRIAERKEFDGILCEKDEEVSFEKDGLKGCRIVEAENIDGVDLPAGVEFERMEKSLLVIFTKNQEFQGDFFPEGAELLLLNGHKFKLILPKPWAIQGYTWTDVSEIFYHPNGRIKSGEIAGEQSILGIWMPDETKIGFSDDGKLLYPAYVPCDLRKQPDCNSVKPE